MWRWGAFMDVGDKGAEKYMEWTSKRKPFKSLKGDVKDLMQDFAQPLSIIYHTPQGILII